MEAVSLNSEPVFEDGDEYEDEGECTLVEHENEIHETQKPSLPTVGLEFVSFDEAYDFYNVYAKEQGFGIRVTHGSDQKGKNGIEQNLAVAMLVSRKKAGQIIPDLKPGPAVLQ
nr:protein FAR1-RELATED SEQUENCE 6-like [Ipomoea batatas]